MKQLSLMIDLSRCIGCKTCIVACRNFHGLVDHAAAMPNEIPYYLRVESRMEGSYPKLSQESWVVPCQHCKNAQCIKACKSEAISKNPETGIVHIDRDKCTGSKACIEACPYDVIQFNEEGGFAHKCTLCQERVLMGQQPVCAEVCMTDAISFGEKDQLKQQAMDQGREILKKLSAQSIIYVR
ncbi:MAG: 4Fe-4S dicluster domain-containing protein [Desulfovibrio sp.]|nr:MAG: 4Fe-4S dicluster domain-containing protein [Desulfovibrio sp.]